jgi:predicted unusual protein kinase regulating ubiquinone biosynthesis (AarF/ABC1/UbiB family)
MQSVLCQWPHCDIAAAAAVVCRVPAYYALILRSLTVLEGLALQADPQYKLLGRAYPYIARRLLTDPAPELRASFEELILKVRAEAERRGCEGIRVWR